MGAQSILAGQALSVLQMLNDFAAWHYSHVVGGIITDGGTTQGTGAGGALNFDADVSDIDAAVNGVGHVLAAGADVDSDGGTQVTWTATSGQSAIGALVLETGSDNDTPARVVVFGAVATTGAEVTATDDEIDTAIGHSNWVRIGDFNVERTGDTAVAVIFDHTTRPAVTLWQGNLAEDEDTYAGR